MSSMEKVLILLMAAFVLGLGYMAYDILDDEVSNAPGQTLPPKKVTADDSRPTALGGSDSWNASGRHGSVSREVEPRDLPPGDADARPDKPVAGTGAIKGIVIGADAKPLVGARLEVSKGSNTLIPVPAARKPTGITARTDEHGRFVMYGVTPGRNYVVVASHPDYSDTETGPVVVQSDQITFLGKMILRRGLSVYGTVTDEAQRPVPAAEVSLTDQYASAFLKPGDRQAWKTIRTDEQGRYRFENLHFNSFQISVAAESYGTQVRNNASFMRRAKDCQMDFQLTRANRIGGWITDSDGQPITEAEVSATLINSKYASRGAAKSDEAGRFDIGELVEGFYMMRFERHGYTAELLQRVRTGDDQIRVTMLPNGGIEGHVVDASTNSPVTQFIITVKKHRENRPPHATGIIKRVNSPDGAFHIDDLDPENYTIYVTAGGYAVAASEPIQVRRAQTVQGVRVGMDHGGAVKGLLLDSSGKPVSGAMIKINPNKFRSNPLVELFSGMNEDPSRPERSTVSDAEGRFHIDMILPGTYQLEIEHPAFSRMAVNDLSVVRGSTQDAGQIRLSNGGIVAGKVTGAGGEALAGATVNASTKTGFMRSARSDEEGSFRIENLPPGNYHVSIQDWVPEKNEPIHPLERLVQARNASAKVYVEDGRTARVDLHLSGR